MSSTSIHRKSAANMMKIFHGKDKNKQRLYNQLDKFLQWKGAPSWFRGISAFQLQAARRLHFDLRDDLGQNTTHRVRADLVELGLKPLFPTNKNLKTLMQMSRTNDIAFLWFLWEWFYKSNNGELYTTNEQLILSTISNLDMIPTLRELDVLLPSPQPPKKILQKRKKLAEEKELELKRKQSRKSQPRVRKHSGLPYFWKLPLPRPYGKPLEINRPDYKVDLRKYDLYKDPEYVAPNETTRWYGSYSLSPKSRVVHRIIKDDILEDLLGSSNNAIVKVILKDALNNVFSKEDFTPQICEHHKRANEEKEIKRMQKEVDQREQCLKMLDTERYKREKRKERVVRQLDECVQKFVLKYRKKLARSCHDCVAELLSETFICAIHLVDDACADAASERCEEFEDEENISLMEGDFLIEKFSSGQKISYPHREAGLHDYDGDTDCATTSSTSNDRPRGGGFCMQHPRSAKDPINYAKNVCVITDPEMYNYGHSKSPTPTASQIFFKSTTDHKPLHFNYGKVFCFDRQSGSSLNIKKYIVEALDGQVEPCKTLQDSPPKVDKALDACAKKTFKEGAAIKKAIMEAEEKRLAQASLVDGKLKFDQEYFDPDDRELMMQMLKTAFKRMSKDPSFVLACLPGANRLPVLIEWISARYGKRYTEHERIVSYKFSKRLFNTMGQLFHNVIPVPQAKEFGKQPFVSYGCRNYLLRKNNHIRQKFYRDCNNLIMEEARVYWFTMRPLLGQIERARPSFFAYLPSRETDITLFRPWRRGEYTDMKLIRAGQRRKALQMGQAGDK